MIPSQPFQNYLESESFKMPENKLLSPNDPRLPKIQKFFQTNLEKEAKKQTKKAKLTLKLQEPAKSANNFYDLQNCRKILDGNQALSPTYNQETDTTSPFNQISFHNSLNQRDFENLYNFDQIQCQNTESPPRIDTMANHYYPSIQISNHFSSNLQDNPISSDFDQTSSMAPQAQENDSTSSFNQFSLESSQGQENDIQDYSDIYICVNEIENYLNLLKNGDFEKIDFSEFNEIEYLINEWSEKNEIIYSAPENIIIKLLFSNLFNAVVFIKSLIKKINCISSEEKRKSVHNKMEVMRKQKCINKLSKDNRQNHSLIRILRNQITKLAEERNEKSEQLRILFGGNPEMQELINSIDEKSECGPPILSKVLIDELIKNFDFKPNGRRWSIPFKKVCFIIATYSTAAYNALCDFFPFPSYKTIQKEFKCKINEVKKNLLNIDQLHTLLTNLHKYYTDDEKEVIDGVLAVDAASMNPQKTGESGFIGCLFQPFNKKYPSRNLSLMMRL